LAFGLWAQRLRQAPGGSEVQAPIEVLEAIDSLEVDVSKLRQELSETQERLDFTERLLAQGQEQRQAGLQR
jgi:predicted ATP-grasp superfamily ATP-dependent carboligase